MPSIAASRSTSLLFAAKTLRIGTVTRSRERPTPWKVHAGDSPARR